MKTLNAYVVAMGWAKSDRSWNLFNSLESKAQKQKKGMWRKYYLAFVLFDSHWSYLILI